MDLKHEKKHKTRQKQKNKTYDQSLPREKKNNPDPKN